MKRKTILSALFSAFVACFFVACSNESDALDINAGTRSATSSSYMTREEVQTRLDEIGEKYGTRVIMDEKVNIDLVSEDIFTKLEEHISSKELLGDNVNTKAHIVNEISNDSLLMNDSSIDDIMLMAAPPSGETYSGSFTHFMNITCGAEYNSPTTIKINWNTNSLGVSASLSLNASITTGHGSGVNITFSQEGGTPDNPSFKYSGYVLCYAYVLEPSFRYIYDDNQIVDSVNNVSIRYMGERHPFSGFYPVN